MSRLKKGESSQETPYTDPEKRQQARVAYIRRILADRKNDDYPKSICVMLLEMSLFSDAMSILAACADVLATLDAALINVCEIKIGKIMAYSDLRPETIEAFLKKRCDENTTKHIMSAFQKERG